MTMLHAWIRLDNPAGMFAAENWAIPYFRLGLPPPPHDAPESAANALALAVSGTGYFAASVAATAVLRPAEHKKVDAAFAQARSAVQTRLHAPDAPSPASLSAIWTRLWQDIDASVSTPMPPSAPPTGAALPHAPVR